MHLDGGGLWVGIGAALITAVPATLAAWGAWRKSAQVSRHVATGNGSTIGEMVAANAVAVAKAAVAVADLSTYMYAHAEDDRRHFASIYEALGEDHVRQAEPKRQGGRRIPLSASD